MNNQNQIQYLKSAFNHIIKKYTTASADEKVKMNDDMITICRQMDELDAEVSAEMETEFRRLANV